MINRSHFLFVLIFPIVITCSGLPLFNGAQRNDKTQIQQSCRTNDSCTSGWKCSNPLSSPPLSDCTVGSKQCFCVPEIANQPTPCTYDEQCKSGVCIGGAICFPEKEQWPLQELVQQCETNNDCKSDARCLDPQSKNPLTPCGTNSKLCFCVPKVEEQLKTCKEDKECKSGTCLANIVCLPQVKLGNEKEEEDEEGGCIAIHLLQSFKAPELIYEKHRIAKVLCDTNLSCATPGHIVHWKGHPMMMSTYCRHIENGCAYSTMRVNSPRWVRSLRVVSKTKKLEFTAFAAKYETTLEEKLLSTAVRMGL